LIAKLRKHFAGANKSAPTKTRIALWKNKARLYTLKGSLTVFSFYDGFCEAVFCVYASPSYDASAFFHMA
jgi:hypothetical protein